MSFTDTLRLERIDTETILSSPLVNFSQITIDIINTKMHITPLTKFVYYQRASVG